MTPEVMPLMKESYNMWHHPHSFPERELCLGCLLSNKQTEAAETSSWCRALQMDKDNKCYMVLNILTKAYDKEIDRQLSYFQTFRTIK